MIFSLSQFRAAALAALWPTFSAVRHATSVSRATSFLASRLATRRMAAVDGLPAAGQVGVFTFNGSAWGEAAVLTAPVPQESAGFGTAVAISGDVLVVGAPMHDTVIRNEGLVHIFRFVSPVWTLETTLAAPDAAWFACHWFFPLRKRD